MGEVAHRRSDDGHINYLAFDILSTQQGQIGVMSGWLDLWEQSQRGSAEPMQWMGHAWPMPSMATPAEIRAGHVAGGRDGGGVAPFRLIRHHREAVPMAEAAAADADSPEMEHSPRRSAPGSSPSST